jgi:opacity protein-like surface antigen
LLATAGAASPAPIEIAGEGQLGYFRMAASDSASALFGSGNALTLGGALRATLWRGAFVSIGVRTFAKEGERVFVATPDSPVQKLGHPLTMRTTPAFVSAGYRFRNGKRIVPYLSVGVAVAFYRERSEVAGERFDVDKTKAGFVGAAGVEIGRGLLRFGAEVGYTTIPNTIGSTGVSQVYGETDAGGFHAVGKVILAFGI